MEYVVAHFTVVQRVDDTIINDSPSPLLDSYLSAGQHYLPFELLGPEFWVQEISVRI